MQYVMVSVVHRKMRGQQPLFFEERCGSRIGVSGYAMFVGIAPLLSRSVITYNLKLKNTERPW